MPRNINAFIPPVRMFDLQVVIGFVRLTVRRRAAAGRFSTGRRLIVTRFASLNSAIAQDDGDTVRRQGQTLLAQYGIQNILVICDSRNRGITMAV